MIFGVFGGKFWPEKITSRDGCFLLMVGFHTESRGGPFGSTPESTPIWESTFRNGLSKNTLLDNRFSARPLRRSFGAP